MDGDFLSRVPQQNPPVDRAAPFRQLPLHQRHAAVVTRLPQPKRTNQHVRLDRLPVVVVATHAPQASIIAAQDQVVPVFADSTRRVVVLKPDRPERIRLQLVNPVRVAACRRSQVDVKRFPFLLVPQ